MKVHFFGNILKHERLGIELKTPRGREESSYVLLLTLLPHKKALMGQVRWLCG